MIRVRLVGGIAGGRELSLDRRDVLPSIKVGVLNGRAVVLGTSPDPRLVARVRGAWVDYWLWPRSDPNRMVEYRDGRPPGSGRARFSASG